MPGGGAPYALNAANAPTITDGPIQNASRERSLSPFQKCMPMMKVRSDQKLKIITSGLRASSKMMHEPEIAVIQT